MQKELETNQLVEEPQHVTPQVTPPPELPEAPPRTALIIVGLVWWCSAVSGAASMFSRVVQAMRWPRNGS